MASVVSREAYFETGLDVLSDLGYGGLKLAEVCNRLGVTTGSFYHYFPGWPAYTRELVGLPHGGGDQVWVGRQAPAASRSARYRPLRVLDSGRFASVPDGD